MHSIPELFLIPVYHKPHYVSTKGPIVYNNSYYECQSDLCFILFESVRFYLNVCIIFGRFEILCYNINIHFNRQVDVMANVLALCCEDR